MACCLQKVVLGDCCSVTLFCLQCPIRFHLSIFCSFVTVLKHWRGTIWSAEWLVFNMRMPLNSTAVYIQFPKSSWQSLIISSFYWVGRRKDRLRNIHQKVHGFYLFMKRVCSFWKILVLTWECVFILRFPGSSSDDSGFLCLV